MAMTFNKKKKCISTSRLSAMVIIMVMVNLWVKLKIVMRLEFVIAIGYEELFKDI